MIIELELHPKWNPNWDIEKRERAALALCTHLVNSKVHTIHGLKTDILSARPDRILGVAEPHTAAELILITLDIQEVS